VYNADLRRFLDKSAFVFKWLLVSSLAAYSLLGAFAAGICLLAERDAFMRTICTGAVGALPRGIFLA
jgi:hypothetical protein